MDQLADIMAFRVLVPDVSDCYRALGQLHLNYPTVMGRFMDYIRPETQWISIAPYRRHRP